MEYTKNYKLPQWVESDRIMMEDFNRMCRDMEAGLDAVKSEAAAESKELAETMNTNLSTLTTAIGSSGQNCRIEVGSYVGNGKYGKSNKIQLTFHIYPVLIWVCSNGYTFGPSVMVRPCDSAASGSGYLSTIEWGEKLSVGGRLPWMKYTIIREPHITMWRLATRHKQETPGSEEPGVHCADYVSKYQSND